MERKTPVDIGKFRAAATKPAKKPTTHGNEPAPAGKLLVMPPPAPPTPEMLREYVDEYARLAEQIGPLEKRKAFLRARLISLHNLAPTETVVAVGNNYEVEIGPEGSQKKVTAIRELFEYLKPERFFGACSVTLKALDEYVPKADRDKFTSEIHTESRDLTVTRRFKEAA